mgnify:CR=1 FL=1|tara:strand:+ start:15 stop:215 length:201 start_codon:yes stop_codon:yes gene_type:complete
MKLEVIKTTDNNFLGRTFDVPSINLTGVNIPVSTDVVFSITKSEDLGGGIHRYSNSNYIVIVREVG